MNSIKKLLSQLKEDETGIVISSELVLIATICILPLIVGLSEISSAINQELSEVAEGFSSANQIDFGWNGSQNNSFSNPQCDIYCDR